VSLQKWYLKQKKLFFFCQVSTFPEENLPGPTGQVRKLTCPCLFRRKRMKRLLFYQVKQKKTYLSKEKKGLWDRLENLPVKRKKGTLGQVRKLTSKKGSLFLFQILFLLGKQLYPFGISW